MPLAFLWGNIALCKINSAGWERRGFPLSQLHTHLLKMIRCHLTVDIYNAEFMVSWFGFPLPTPLPSFPVVPCVSGLWTLCSLYTGRVELLYSPERPWSSSQRASPSHPSVFQGPPRPHDPPTHPITQHPLVHQQKSTEAGPETFGSPHWVTRTSMADKLGLAGVADEPSTLNIFTLLERVSGIIDNVQACQQRMEERQLELENTVKTIQVDVVKLTKEHTATSSTVDKLLEKTRKVSCHVKDVRVRVEKQNMRVKKVEETQVELLNKNKFRVVIYQVRLFAFGGMWMFSFGLDFWG